MGSKYFATENKFIALAKAMRRSRVDNGKQWYENPYANKNGKREAQVQEIAKTKLPDLNCLTIESAVNQVLGTAKSMGVEVKG